MEGCFEHLQIPYFETSGKIFKPRSVSFNPKRKTAELICIIFCVARLNDVGMGIGRSNRDVARSAGENRSVAIPQCQQNPNYQKWYDAMMRRARSREMPTCYTEVHHILPRSLGGSDGEYNLVRLTYREHYIAHWLLTKIHVGISLHKMQRALWAMTLKASGERITAGWQIEVAKRAVRDMELNDEVDRAWLERWRKRNQAAADAMRELDRQYEMRRAAEVVEFIKDHSPEYQEKILRDIWAKNPERALYPARGLAKIL